MGAAIVVVVVALVVVVIVGAATLPPSTIPPRQLPPPLPSLSRSRYTLLGGSLSVGRSSSSSPTQAPPEGVLSLSFHETAIMALFRDKIRSYDFSAS